MKYRFIVLVCVVLFGVYLNRSYASIYRHISNERLPDPHTTEPVLILNPNPSQLFASSSITYVALGDSLTAGIGSTQANETFPYLFGRMLASASTSVRLINLSVPGATAAEVRSKQVTEVATLKPDFVTLLSGINDIHNFVSRQTFENNYRATLDTLTNTPSTTVIVLSIPYLGSPRLIKPPYRWYFIYKTKQYNAIIERLAAEYGVLYVDLYRLNKPYLGGNPELYSSDLFHPSPKSYAIWSNLIYADFRRLTN